MSFVARLEQLPDGTFVKFRRVGGAGSSGADETGGSGRYPAPAAGGANATGESASRTDAALL